MFNGRRKNKRKDDQGSSSRSNPYNDEVIEEIDMNDIKLDSMRSRISNPEKMNAGSSTFSEDIDRVYSRGQSGSIGDVIDDAPKLQRGLKARHLTMISLGGTIGTGLFLASGASVANAGPGGALIAYALIGIMVFFMMECLGEMATYLPISGSFNNYAGRFIDPAVGFALGWNYWYNWAVTVAVELTAGSMVMAYWLPHVPSYVWSIIFLVIILALNLFSVKGYGEAEYWFALIKVLTVIVFIFLGILVDTAVLGDTYYGVATFNAGGVQGLGVLSTFLTAGFSFQGTELIGVAAGESENPRKNVPKAIKQVFWRIVLFYILSILIIGLIIPYDDPQLLNSDVQNISISPFTLVFLKAGIAPAAHIMNAVILTTVLSAGNSGLYASSRTLLDLAIEGKAPKIFKRITKNGIPIYCVLLTAAIGMLAFLTSLFGNGVVYSWLMNISGVAGFIAWLGIAASHWRFRRAYVAQGYKVEDLPFKARLFPIGPIFAFGICSFVIVGQGYDAWFADPVSASDIIACYIGVPVFVIIYAGYKIVKKSKVIPLVEIDLISGREEFE
ncbi:amino acid permease/ SLC12A domain-containing protein [Mucor lusitanicus]|uniref:Amino acid permease/ SLC12A domain-containing protein n=1 Tax=Mucor circinelloides f. lusitanicus TaxID=29924 RepID=A0A8H4B6E3_MUCCL|nr:amino acid permease/ SLC12A domain-containing protein [Mucor lusitanicus]KAF1806144.1 amino acid permease/ SLC12A domain-containing protein [Mucor lusitanicus]